ncbi:hypothetical protein WQ74_25770 [Escherichia coli]|nr:hypothetical protein WQ74_25770 [Escherichia coli]
MSIRKTSKTITIFIRSYIQTMKQITSVCSVSDHRSFNNSKVNTIPTNYLRERYSTKCSNFIFIWMRTVTTKNTINIKHVWCR